MKYSDQSYNLRIEFQRYDEHPREVPFGDWLEKLIDPSVKLLSEDTDEELANISFARSAIEAEK
mgnify:FL=1